MHQFTKPFEIITFGLIYCVCVCVNVIHIFWLVGTFRIFNDSLTMFWQSLVCIVLVFFRPLSHLLLFATVCSVHTHLHRILYYNLPGVVLSCRVACSTYLFIVCGFIFGYVWVYYVRSVRQCIRVLQINSTKFANQFCPSLRIKMTTNGASFVADVCV